ncbi:hypothetical protein T4B_10590 [Trichinella pseudospiralis]|uniref:Uncharacterized protein n=1 Tax=Trichinella pseudospiralis TaxID=6337 RepID=A0A0V1K9U2_TRIPS|nr:hypothetical protein T4A_5285 [Trichinella pseudospiralis]KRZ34927.1 hypothetical protein T4B_10590 [Trichinella pseudospiralis]KRZ43982.1 hypothetical protein T4C_3474 [Trichinella pseudospiralis]
MSKVWASVERLAAYLTIRQDLINRRLGYRELRPLCRISDASDGKLDSNWNEFMTKMYCAVDSHNYTCNSQNRGKSSSQ